MLAISKVIPEINYTRPGNRELYDAEEKGEKNIGESGEKLMASV